MANKKRKSVITTLMKKVRDRSGRRAARGEGGCGGEGEGAGGGRMCVVSALFIFRLGVEDVGWGGWFGPGAPPPTRGRDFPRGERATNPTYSGGYLTPSPRRLTASRSFLHSLDPLPHPPAPAPAPSPHRLFVTRRPHPFPLSQVFLKSKALSAAAECGVDDITELETLISGATKAVDKAGSVLRTNTRPTIN